jgi:segregation and condensation protein B
LTALEITELINQAFGFMDEKISVEQVDASIEGIVEKYNSNFTLLKWYKAAAGGSF